MSGVAGGDHPPSSEAITATTPGFSGSMSAASPSAVSTFSRPNAAYSARRSPASIARFQ
jgi:hypothetical protein